MNALARLGVVLGLAGAAGAAIVLGLPVEETRRSGFAIREPDLPGWTAEDGAPRWAVPGDSRETSSVRRSYRKGGMTLWTSLALFSRQDDPGRRPAILYPERGTSQIEHTRLQVVLARTPEVVIDMPILIGQKGERRLVMAYWYQLGRRPFGSQYLYRLELLRRVLLERRADAALVRIAAAIDAEARLPASLGAFAEVAPSFYSAVAHALNSELEAR